MLFLFFFQIYIALTVHVKTICVCYVCEKEKILTLLICFIFFSFILYNNVYCYVFLLKKKEKLTKYLDHFQIKHSHHYVYNNHKCTFDNTIYFCNVLQTKKKQIVTINN